MRALFIILLCILGWVVLMGIIGSIIYLWDKYKTKTEDSEPYDKQVRQAYGVGEFKR